MLAEVAPVGITVARTALIRPKECTMLWPHGELVQTSTERISIGVGNIAVTAIGPTEHISRPTEVGMLSAW